MVMSKKLLTLILLLASFSSMAEEKNKKSINTRHKDTVHIIARQNESVPVNLPSSSYVISNKYVKERQYTDIERILTATPSVQIRSEDGLGLRPNIGIRGSSMERSAGITLMEDGTLIAPAAYSAPAAYYFPEVLRMSEFEVYTGGSSVQYGPRTTSGTLNMVTQPIDGQSSIMASVGSFNEKIMNAKVSHKGENAGFVFTAVNKYTDGFKKIEGASNSNTNNSHYAGALQTDYMLKTSFNTNEDAKVYQKLDIKLAELNHNSDQSYLGLTEEDFAQDPYRQYAGSQMDNMKTKHRQAEIKHTMEVGSFSLATKVYHNTFARNWYKLNKVNGKKLSTVLKDPLTNAVEFSYLNGSANATSGELSVKGNNRRYVSEGVQMDGTYKVLGNTIAHQIDAGVRLHSDSEDRFQGSDTYNMINGQMVLNARGVMGGSASDNKLASASAFAGYIKNTITVGNLTFVPGVRYEHVNLKEESWSDTGRATVASDKAKNVSEFMPSLSTSYMLTENSAVFGGVHKGFSPPAPSSGEQVDNEKSINYELGYRIRNEEDQTFFEIVSYFNDYKNLLGADTLAGGGGGTGSQYNGGSVHTYGVELLTGKTFVKNEFSFPVMIAYTFTNAVFQNTFVSSLGEWGGVIKGDRLPYISKHQFTLNAGVKYGKVSANLLSRFVGSSYAEAQALNKVPSYMIFDIIGHYKINDNITTFLAVDNLTNRKYLTGYNPYGLRSGRPIAFKVGGVYKF
ncbi:MAG: Fe(3+) dicitrate transport protein [Candidatus Deianiraeaceae bacterium]|jgi:Fe(3+) dicitrate transport protein